MEEKERGESFLENDPVYFGKYEFKIILCDGVERRKLTFFTHGVPELKDGQPAENNDSELSKKEST